MIQLLINLFYRHPKAKLKNIAQFGGYINYKHMMYNRWLMKRASRQLLPVHSYPDGLSVFFLTGKNYLYQTLFCIQSLNKHSTEKFRFTLVDDGSFNKKLIDQINKQLPGADIVTRLMIQENLKKSLPHTQYPVLHRKREEYPHIKKLTDIHTLPGNGWKLVFDSDMLFWSEPAAMINWLKNPHKPMHMIDCTESYGYSRKLMEQLADKIIPALINVGLMGLNSNSINWQKLENWVKIMEEKEGKTYYLEQALSAMLIANDTCMVLEPDQYIVNPNKEVLSSSACLHHYVDLSKKLYYNVAWKSIK